MPGTTFFLLLILIFFGFDATASSSGKKSGENERALVLRTVTVIDGTGRQPYGPTDVEIIAGKISRIGPHLKSQLAIEIDGRGKTLVPGLIDCHTHLPSVPGSFFRKETESSLRAQQLQQMKIYLAAGVTTLLDAASPASLFANVEKFAQTNTLPRFFGLAPFLTPIDGYMASPQSRSQTLQDLWPPVQTADDVRKMVAQAKHLRPFGIKVTEEFGFGPFKVWPVFSDEIRKAIVEVGEEFETPVLVHSEREEEFRNGLKLRPYAFMHGGFFDETPSPELLEKIRVSGAYVVSTVGIFKMMNLMWNREPLDDPWLKLLVPSRQLETALDPEITTKVVEALAVQNKPWFAPKFMARWFSSFFVNERTNLAQLASSERAIGLMFRAGIPIVMGADAGNWPVLTTMFHGVGSIFDLEALMEAGLTPVEALQSATSRAAAMLKISDVVGSIEKGKIADLVLLNADPLTNRQAFRDVDLVFKDGIGKTPSDWLK
jgi:imidazolonepropionase-like amidohydrolase